MSDPKTKAEAEEMARNVENDAARCTDDASCWEWERLQAEAARLRALVERLGE